MPSRLLLVGACHSDDGVGGQDSRRDTDRVLKGRPRNLQRVNHTHLIHVTVLLGLDIVSVALRLVLVASPNIYVHHTRVEDNLIEGGTQCLSKNFLSHGLWVLVARHHLVVQGYATTG